MTNHSDEIDVVEMLRNFFSFLGKYKWILILVFIGGLVLGYFKVKQRSHPSNAYYRTQFLVSSEYLDNDEIYMIGRDLAFTDIENGNTEKAIFSKINELEVSKDVIENEKTEINMVFVTNESIDAKQLHNLIVDKINSNSTFKANLDIAKQHFEQQLNLLKGNAERTESTILEEVELLEKKQEIERKMLTLNQPVKCLPIAPTNKLYPAPNFSVLLVVGYGIILSLFAGLVIWCIGFLKNVLA